MGNTNTNAKLSLVKKDINNLLELINLAENDQISLAGLGRKLGMTPQGVNAALENSFQSYIKKGFKSFTDDDIEKILFRLEMPSVKLLRDIFEIESVQAIKFPEYDENHFWNVVRNTLTTSNYFEIVCKRIGYNESNTPLTFDQIAKDYNLSRMRVNAIYKSAISKLRAPEVINQIFSIDYINKIEQIEDLQKDLINKCNETYNSYNKLNSCISKVSSVKEATKFIIDKYPELDKEVKELPEILSSDLDVNINNLGFSNRTLHCLTEAGYTTVSKICNASPVDIICINNLGKTCISEIVDKLDIFAKGSLKWGTLRKDLCKLIKKGY